MPSCGCIGPCSACAREADFARLVLEQVHGVTGVMPQQMIGPTTRLAQRIGVGPAEEIGLHVHLLNLQLAGLDALMNPLVAGIEAPGVAAHADDARLLLHLQQPFGVGQVVGNRDFDHHVLARAHALLGLLRVHLGRASRG